VILVDTSVWVDHLRRGDPPLARALAVGAVLAHPFVIGEIACGLLPRRAETLALLAALPATPVAGHEEALGFIERHRLAGRGVGYVDIHLLASSALAGAKLWTRDKRLAAVAVALRLQHAEPAS
jgi:predicted nucleic acid-binding protein